MQNQIFSVIIFNFKKLEKSNRVVNREMVKISIVYIDWMNILKLIKIIIKSDL